MHSELNNVLQRKEVPPTVVPELQGTQTDAALRFSLLILKPFFDDDSLTEICVNEPGVVITQSHKGKQIHEVKELTYDRCMKLAQLIATQSGQSIGPQKPILSATLPDGQRCQIAIPPVALAGTVSFTIRKPSAVAISLAKYEESGAFANVIEKQVDLLPFEKTLLELKASRKYREFIELAVSSHRNILISGATGSGKTTFAKAVIAEVPADERLISIENVDELKLRNTHRDSVAMFYSAGGQGLAKVTPQDLMQSSLRQKPDRVFLAELITGDEAFYFLDTVSSGHPGSISTMHSETPTMCIERLCSLIRRSEVGRTMSSEDVRKMVFMCVDVIIQFKVVDKVRCVTEIYYDPAVKKSFLG